MFYLIYLLIIGASFSPFLFPQVDIWIAQGLWVQSFVAICFAWSFFEKGKVGHKNIEFGLFFLWITIFMLFINIISNVKGFISMKHTFAYFNMLTMVIFYKIIAEYMDRSKIEQLLWHLRYVVIGTLFICVLQRLGLSQYFVLFDQDNLHKNNIMVGFIGNPTHLSGLLACCVPLFLWKRTREDWLAIVLMVLVLTQTGTQAKGMLNPAINGFIILFFVFLYMLKDNKKYLLFCLFFVLCAVGIFLVCGFTEMVSDNGRLEWWGYYLNIWKNQPITGFGPGTVNKVFMETPYKKLAHLHNEHFQIMFEIGLVGLFIWIGMITKFFQTIAADKTQQVLKAVILGFLISGIFNYPFHLWLPSSIAVFCYASFFTLKQEM